MTHEGHTKCNHIDHAIAVVNDELADAQTLWLTFDRDGDLYSVHVGDEPEFSQDEGLTQINMSSARIKWAQHDRVTVSFEGIRA